MKLPRASGLLLHPTSLPGRFGIGDSGPEAYRFVDLLVEMGQTYWQILPLQPTGPGDSPYSTFSAFAGNPLLISPEQLLDDRLLSDAAIRDLPDFSEGRVDYGAIYEWKTKILAQAFENFRSSPSRELETEFIEFSHRNAWWLDDYAAFRAVKAAHGHKAWYEWGEPLRSRDPDALQKSSFQLKREIDAERFYQFLFFRSWTSLKQYANESGVKIIGDIPIFVALDSADVWCNQRLFKLNSDGSPKVVAGVPPDYFSKTGQMWGNPIYDWEALRTEDFGWWTARIAFSFLTADIVRLDHFIGFVRNWEVPAADKTAENGSWAQVPGGALFATLTRRLGSLDLLAEDLGSITAEVEALRDRHEMPGMRILQYAFGGDPNDANLPHNYIRNTVAYTGTHDNDTTAGWYKKASKTERGYCRKYLQSNGRDIHKDMVRSLFSSVADTVIIPLQDLLGLPGESRMNIPATSSANWQWRLREGQLTADQVRWLKDMTPTYGRLHQ